MPAIFPFTAIVGQDRMRRALMLNAVDTRIGGVLIRGERGTAKSTAARAFAALLPHVKSYTTAALDAIPINRDMVHRMQGTRRRDNTTSRGQFAPTPLVNLPVSATEDRVVGTLDIEKAIQKGERHFEPGVLAAANRGCYILTR